MTFRLSEASLLVFLARNFLPLAFQPGSVGDKDYSPLVQVVNAAGVIYNAPIVAFDVTANQISFPEW